MKKSATLLALLAAMLCTFSCMKETDFGTGPAPEGYYEEIITTVIPGGGTRTSFDNTTGVFSWSDGDEIAFHLSNGEYITAPINPETGKVRLYLPEGVTRDEFAVYPASTVVTDHAEKGDMQLTLPDSYDISGALQSEYCPTTMLAVQDPESSTLRFNHAGGLVQLNLEVPAQTKTVKVEFPDRVVTGTIPVSADNTYYKLDLDDPEHNEEGGSEIDIKVSQEGLEEDTAVRINIPVPSGSYNDLKITYNDGNADTWEYDRDATLNVGRGAGKRISPDESEFIDATNYFHFIALEDNSTVTLSCPNSAMYYSIDGKRTWNSYTSGTTITLENEGNIVWFYNTNNLLSNASTKARFTGTGSLAAAGKLATLKNKTINENEFISEAFYSSLFNSMTSLKEAHELYLPENARMGNSVFSNMFRNCTELKTAPKIITGSTVGTKCFENMFYGCTSLETGPEEIVATDMSSYYTCYQMFYNCTSLTTAPKISATIVGSNTCNQMFYNCTSLITPPEVLPATTLGLHCYTNMFENCTSMTSAPRLPATKIEDGSYCEMFKNCISLTTPPELPATTFVGDSNYYRMFYKCTSLTTTPELPATELPNGAYSEMFRYCSSLVTATELPATTIGAACYQRMFSDCTSLKTATKKLPATIAKENCYEYMFYNCKQLTEAPQIEAETIEKEACKWMFASCKSLTTVPDLPATTLGQSAYYYMFNGCSSLTTCPEISATTLAKECCRSMFLWCSSLTTPCSILPATTLEEGCYREMFYGCSSLTKAPELPATTLVRDCYQAMFMLCENLSEITCFANNTGDPYLGLTQWVDSVSSTGRFYRNAAATNWTTGYSGIPSGWTVYTVEDITPQI